MVWQACFRTPPLEFTLESVLCIDQMHLACRKCLRGGLSCIVKWAFSKRWLCIDEERRNNQSHRATLTLYTISLSFIKIQLNFNTSNHAKFIWLSNIGKNYWKLQIDNDYRIPAWNSLKKDKTHSFLLKTETRSQKFGIKMQMRTFQVRSYERLPKLQTKSTVFGSNFWRSSHSFQQVFLPMQSDLRTKEICIFFVQQLLYTSVYML